jgi:hypothetical protein
MNILQQEDLVKGAPDEVLLQEAQSPSGQVPQYLVVSEIQRRKDMRQRFAAEEEQPQQTVAEQIVAESASPQGIAALLPQTPPQAPVGSVPSSPPMPPPQMPPQMMAAQMAPAAPQPQPEMMADGGIVPNAIIEDASKFNPESLYDVGPMQQRAMANSTDMGIPKTLGGEESKGSLASMFKEIIARAKEGARLGDFGIRDDSITGRGSVMLPVRGNPLELGASGYVGSGGAGITGLDLSYEMPKNRFIRGQYQPRDKSWGVQVGGRFNQGGIVKMQQGQVVDPVDPMGAYAEQQQQRYDQMRKYIEDANTADRERQEQEMMSQALINVGAGIAGGNVAAGLEKAGASVAEIRKEQRDREKALELQMIKEMPGGSGAYKDLPSSVREYQYFMSLSPEGQAQFLDLKRQNYELAEVNGVLTIVRKVGNLFFDQNNNPVIPDAGTVTTAVPSGAGAPVTDTGAPVADGVDVSAADEPQRVLYGGVDSEGNEIRRSFVDTPIFMQPLETIESLEGIADYQEDRQILRDLRREREEGALSLKSRLEVTIATSNRVNHNIDRMMANVDRWAVGSGSLLQWVPESDALEMRNDLDLLKANLAFDRLQQMRDSSPTGGALGQVSELELRLLESAMASLSQGLSPEAFKERLSDVKRLYGQLRDKALKDYSYAMTTTVNPDARSAYDDQISLYQDMIDGVTEASEADKETAQRIISDYNSITSARGTQTLQSGGVVSIDPVEDISEQESSLDYLNSLRSEIASLQGVRG